MIKAVLHQGGQASRSALSRCDVRLRHADGRLRMVSGNQAHADTLEILCAAVCPICADAEFCHGLTSGSGPAVCPEYLLVL